MSVLFFIFWRVLTMLESQFQTELIKDLEYIFEGCIVLKNDPNYIQGFPDLLILFENKWAALECKKSEDAPTQPNQSYYVNKLDDMSFASFIYPENKRRVLRELQRAFRSSRSPRLFKS